MLIGIATLISILLFGGAGEIFYVDNLEKGIKKYVLEKDRKKEILADIKNTKTIFKDFEKERRQDFKNFLNLYTEKNTSNEQLDSLSKNLVTKRTNFQAKIIDQRILIFNKIKAEEWNNIIETSVTVTDKRIAKVEKKALKGKDHFTKTKTQIKSLISNSEKKNNLLNGLEEVTKSIKKLESILLSSNSSQNKILADKSSGRTQLLEIVSEDNMNRKPVYESIINFHKNAKDNCSDLEWDKIMKSFTKEMQMSSR